MQVVVNRKDTQFNPFPFEGFDIVIIPDLFKGQVPQYLGHGIITRI